MKRIELFICVSLSAIILMACGKAPSYEEPVSEEKPVTSTETFSEEKAEPTEIESISNNTSDTSESVTEEATEQLETSYHLPDYDYSHDVYGRTNPVFYDGNYYFTGTMNDSYGKKLVKYSADTGKTEIIVDGVEFLYCINDVIYSNKFPPSPDSHMQAFVLDSQELIDDISDGTIGYAGGVVASDSDYLLYMTYDDEIATNFAVSPLYGSNNSKSIKINSFGSILDTYMENGIIYFKGTDDEFAENPDCWYKKYDIATEELTDISESDVPADYVPVEDRGLSEEQLEQYKSLTGSDGTLEAIYHDHLIYNDVRLVDDKFTTIIQIYDYEGNLLDEIKGAGYGYIGCANDNLLYVGSGDNIEVYPIG